MAKFDRTRLGGVALSACLLAAGCAPSLEGNEPREPKKDVPQAFSADGTNEGQSLAQQKWREFFGSSELRSLIEAALRNNQELNIRLQEIIIAQTEIDARKGDYLPKVDAYAGAGVEKVGRYTRHGQVDESLGLDEHMGDFGFGLRGSWEVDVWGKLRNAAKSAQLRYLSSVEGRNFVVTQLVAEIARSYYELVALDRELEVVERNIAIQTDALEVMKIQKAAARVTQLAVQRFEAEVTKNRSRLFELKQERVLAENRINFLVGRFPQPVARNAAAFDEPIPASLHTGLPSKLLENRPDVRQAELALEAAKLDVKSAKAAFYPSLSIDAGVGYNSFNIEHLVTTPESLIYNAAGGLTAPLLNRAAITAQYRSANARQVQAVYEYERAILQAFTDVVNQVSVLDNLRKAYDLQKDQVRLLTDAVDVSNTLFQTARADYMEVLLTRRDSLDAELELVRTKKQQLVALVNLYQALGGGWLSYAKEGPPKDQGGGAPAQPTERKSADAKPTETAPSAQPTEAKPTETAPAAQPAETTPADAKPPAPHP
ncbi:MAG TPA: efflux transporter outer membrane subunit [Polyangiaceae bacterium]|nr:efflux transporter outer membrane subunit [Polyangiaceae bacterium]